MTFANPLKWPEGWKRSKSPGFAGSGPFKVQTDVARRDLYSVLKRLKATGVVVSSNCPLTMDGQPRVEAMRWLVPDSGVAVYFNRGNRPFAIAQEAYTTIGANVRSVSLALEGFLAMERHGGAHLVERAFEGFAMLAPPKPTERPWREVLELHGLQAAPAITLVAAEAAFKALAKKHHPDKQGGNTAAFQELTRAIENARQECSA